MSTRVNGLILSVIPKSTVSDILQNPQPDPNSRTGRPKKITKRAERRILRAIKVNPKISYAELRRRLDLDVSDQTIRRLLHNHHIKKWMAKKRPKLTEKAAKARYEWALAHRDWTWEDWLKVIWSDECSIQRGSGTQREWVFRTPEEKWHKDKITEKGMGKDISIMIWAAIFGQGESSDAYILSRD
ncbi:hypothetical protein AYO22_10478 [Fonsecaea multimorphosa]|nr:hypothetical protein AYO22_10478 [Fonsecaea multimorphosa]